MSQKYASVWNSGNQQSMFMLHFSLSSLLGLFSLSLWTLFTYNQALVDTNIYLWSWTTTQDLPKHTPRVTSLPKRLLISCSVISSWGLDSQRLFIVTKEENLKTSFSKTWRNWGESDTQERRRITHRATVRWRSLIVHFYPSPSVTWETEITLARPSP